MFLRAQLMARLPFSALRLHCNSVPSTSSSVSYLSLASIVLSRCHSHTIAASTPQLARLFDSSLVWSRFQEERHRKEVEEARRAFAKRTGGSSKGGSDPTKPTKEEIHKKAFSLLKRVVATIAVLSAYGCYLISMILDQWKLNEAIPADAPQVDFATFAEKYLRTGEVKVITFVFASEAKAVATLHAGAVIDGEPAQSRNVVINYSNTFQQFSCDVRSLEREMGIPLTQGVDIQSLGGVTILKKWTIRAMALACGAATLWNGISVYKLKLAKDLIRRM